MKQTTTPFRIEKKASFRVIGYTLHTTNQKKEARAAIPSFWSEFKMNEKHTALLPLSNQEPYGLFGINIYNTDASDARKFDYMIAVSSNAMIDQTFTMYEVPAMTWAIFPCTIDTIGKTEAQAITKWLPKYKYKPLNKGYITGKMKSNAPDIEHYKEDGSVEVWIAIEEK